MNGHSLSVAHSSNADDSATTHNADSSTSLLVPSQVASQPNYEDELKERNDNNQNDDRNLSLVPSEKSKVTDVSKGEKIHSNMCNLAINVTTYQPIKQTTLYTYVRIITITYSQKMPIQFAKCSNYMDHQ